MLYPIELRGRRFKLYHRFYPFVVQLLDVHGVLSAGQ